MKSLFLIPYMSLWPTESNEDATFSSPVAVSPVQSRGLATGTLRSLSGRLRICNFHVYIELYRYIISMYIYIDIGFRCSTCSFIYICIHLYIWLFSHQKMDLFLAGTSTFCVKNTLCANIQLATKAMTPSKLCWFAFEWYVPESKFAWNWPTHPSPNCTRKSSKQNVPIQKVTVFQSAMRMA